MGRLLASVFPRARAEAASSRYARDWLAGRDEADALSEAGESVTPDKALTFSAVWACHKILTEAVASLPVRLFRARRDGGRDLAADHRVDWNLHGRPNPLMTPAEYRATMMGAMLARGDALAEKAEAGAEIHTTPLDPNRWALVQDSQDRWAAVGTDRGRGRRVLGLTELSRWRGWASADGVRGVTPLAYARETIGRQIVMGRHASRQFRQGARLRLAMEIPDMPAPDKIAEIKEAFRREFEGADNAGKTLFLWNGAKATPISMNNEDAQFLELWQFHVVEICRFYGVPPHLVYDLTRSTNNNIEHQHLSYLVHTLRPLLCFLEQAMERDLLSPEERASGLWSIKFNVQALLRGDSKALSDMIASGIQWGTLSPNEGRRFLDLNPREDAGGDEYLRPVNMAPAGAEVPAPGAPPAPAEDEGSGGGGPEDEAPGAGRRALGERLRPLARDVAERVAAREERILGPAARKARTLAQLDAAVDALSREHRAFIARACAPLLEALLGPERAGAAAEALARRAFQALRAGLAAQAASLAADPAAAADFRTPIEALLLAELGLETRR